MLAQEVRKPVQKLYSGLDYFQFCEYMGLNPKYDMKYWEAFQQLSGALSAFDDERLQKIIDYTKPAENVCEWTQQDDEESDNWESSCGDVFFFEEGTPEENNIKFCPFCGKPLAWKAYEPEPEEEEE